MKKEDFVSIEIANLLFNKNFTGEMYPYHDEGVEKVSSIPLLWDVQKWFRENHNLSIEVYANASGWNYELCKTNGTHISGNYERPFYKEMNYCGSYDTYELSLNEGIKHALEYI